MPAKTKAQRAHMQALAKCKRAPKIPLAQLGSDAWDEEEEEVNEGAMEPSSDAPHEAETDGAGLHLEEFADLLPSSRSAHENDAVVMGANQSHEDAYRGVRSAAQQLQNGHGTTKPSGKKAGGLKRPSSTLAASRDASTRTKKRLVSANGIRKSAYDELEDSPQKLAPTSRQTTDASAFSPLRRRKKTQPVEQQPHPITRQSGSVHVQAQQDDDDPGATPDRAGQSTQDTTREDPDAMYVDLFPDAVVKQHLAEELDAETGANEIDAIQVAITESKDAAQDQVVPPSPVVNAKPRRGRPPKGDKKLKTKSTGTGGAAMLQVTAQPSPQKQGTPKSTPRSQPRSSARAQRRLNEMSQQRGSAEELQSEAQPTSRPKTAQGSTTQTSPRRSRRIEQSIVDLNQRRNTVAPADSAPNDTAATEGAEPPADDEEDGEELPEKPVVPRISEVLFSNDNVLEDSEQLEAGAGEASTSRKGKRKAPSQATQANTGKRRKKTQPKDEDYEVSDEQQDTEESHGASQRRLWGQWLPLKRIHSNLQYVGCNLENGELCQQNEIDLDDDDVKAVVKLCTEAKRRYQQLAEGTSDGNLDPASVLEDIGRRVDGLRGRDPDYPTHFEDKTKVTNIYFHLIPALVKLVMRAVTCYEALDKDEVPAGQISMNHLRIVLGLVRLTLDMEYAAQKFYKARPDTSDAVVRPVHNDIAVPLGTVRTTFQKILQRHHADIQSAQRRQQEAQDRALRLEQEERRSRQAAELNRIRQKWEQLHRERMAAEGGLMRPAKFAHLRMPDPNLDEDFDGNTFNRISVFHPRVGPPPGLIARAKALVWTEGELRALEDGLRRYAGPMVYERVFREWCPRGRMLNRYNVTEIVAAAEIVKEFYEGQDGEGAEAWVKAIPIWSKPHAVGKENEDESFVDVDEAAGVGVTAGPS